MKTFFQAGIVAALTIPSLVFAETLVDVANTVGNLVEIATPIIVALALVFFFWNLAMYFFTKDDEKKKAITGMVYGVLILFVMVSIWGIVNVLQDTFNVGGTQTVTPPRVEGL